MRIVFRTHQLRLWPRRQMPISQAAIGSGFFDNYVITAIPEPSAMLFGALVCTCVGASAFVRRKWTGGATVSNE